MNGGNKIENFSIKKYSLFVAFKIYIRSIRKT